MTVEQGIEKLSKLESYTLNPSCGKMVRDAFTSSDREIEGGEHLRITSGKCTENPEDMARCLHAMTDNLLLALSCVFQDKIMSLIPRRDEPVSKSGYSALITPRLFELNGSPISPYEIFPSGGGFGIRQNPEWKKCRLVPVVHKITRPLFRVCLSAGFSNSQFFVIAKISPTGETVSGGWANRSSSTTAAGPEAPSRS